MDLKTSLKPKVEKETTIMTMKNLLSIQTYVERKYKVATTIKGYTMTIDVPRELGRRDCRQDKIDYVEALMWNIVDDIRQFPSIMDVDGEMTYESIVLYLMD